MQILKKITMLAFLMSAFAVGAMAQLTGTKNVPGDYATVAAAVTDLNTQGVGAGGVTFVVADGFTETAPAGGYTITNPTGNGAGNPIVFRRATSTGTRPAFTANAALTAGSLTDAIFKIVGTDNLTIDGFQMLENGLNQTTTAASNNMTEFGVALFYLTTTNGSQNVTVQNCIITLNRTYQNTFGVYSNSTHSATAVTTAASATTTDGGNSGLKLYSNSISNVNIGIVVVGPIAVADYNEGLDIGGTAAATGNSVTNYGTTGTFSSYANVSGTVNGVLVRFTRNYNVSFNSIISSDGGTTAGTLRGIYVPSFTTAPTGTLTDSINNNNITVRSGVVAGALQGIVVEATTASTTSTLNINNNDFSNSGHTIAAASGVITFISNAAVVQNGNINTNTFTNMSVNTTGSVTFITDTTTNAVVGGIKNVNGNSIVTAFAKTGAGGTVTLFTDDGSDVAGAFNNSNNNNFSNITVTGAAIILGLSNTNGGSPTKTVTGNTLTNWTGGTGATTAMVVSFSGAATVSNNTVNTISGGGSVTGISTASGGSVTADNFSQNTVHTLSGTGTGVVTGILNSSGTTRNIFRNKIYNLSNSNAGGGASGITVSGGTTVNVYNNLVGDIRTPALNAANSLFGINISGGTTINASFNTVYLNATSTGALFGSSALNASSTPTVTLRNNILVNTSTAAGATGFTVAYRRSSTTLTTYGSASNNNDFFAGTPSATNLIFYDGTNSDQTLGAYKSRVTPRDSASVSENPNFISTSGLSADFLHISTATPTQLESGGILVTGITDDFDGQTRNATTPDIGADEFNGTALDLNPPVISYTNLGNTTSTTNRVITATITDASGVAGGANSPRIYFRKNGGAYSSTQCVLTSGNSYTCTIDYSLVGGVVTGDVINYFIVAQDVNGNVGSNPGGGFAATSINNVTSPPTTPNSYTIVAGFATSVNVGAGETYTSLTNAGGVFDALNAAVLTGNVTINLTADLAGETGAVALNQLNEEGTGAGTFTVTIKPTGAARTISGTSAASSGLIILNGADRVTIDGSLSGGTDRSLTITNATTTSADIWIRSANATNGAVGNTVKNCILNGPAAKAIAGIVAGGNAFGSAADAPNNNNTIQNDLVLGMQNGLFLSGNAATFDQNWMITGNTFGSATVADKLTFRGMFLGGANNFTITQNTILGVVTTGSSTSTGIQLSANATNGSVTRNTISDIKNTSTSGFGTNGIFLAQTSATANVTVANNFIRDVAGFGFNGVDQGDNGYGIVVASGGGYRIYFNSVNLATDQTATGSITSAVNILAAVTTAGSIDLRDNILVNNETIGTRYAVINSSTQGAAVFTDINYNDYFAQNVGRQGTTAYPLLADWQGATGKDANSKAVDPLFVSATDLHLQSGSTVRAMGLPIAGITTDIDGDTRNPSTPDIGADEFAPFVFPTVQFSAANYTGAEGTTATVTVTRTGDTTVASSVNYATSDGTATGGATCGTTNVDYQNASGTLNFAAGDINKTFSVVLCSDSIVKGNETVNLTLTAPTGATLGTPSTSVLTIVNVNPQAPGTLALSAATYSIGEAAGNLTVTVNRTGGSDGAVAVPYTLTNGTATGGASCATSGVDFVNTGGTVSFAGGVTTQTFTVAICNDTLVEGNETFNVVLGAATGGATVGTPSTAVVTIIDDDVAQSGTLALSAATYSVGEAAGNVTITVNRTGGTDGAVGAAYTLTNGTATGGATCAAGVDYINTGGTVSFAAGAATQTFTVAICNDTIVEANETFTVTLANATGGTTIGTPATATVTIIDDDVATGAVTVTATAGTASAAYTNLTTAVAAINDGTHQGAIVVSINQTITEPDSVVINSSGAGSANYTSVMIRPTVDNISDSGPTLTGRGLIELNGADNVTIDGDNPNTSGTNRNLTLQNTAANTVTFTSVIRVAVAATIVTSADNNTFRNLNILGSATGRNIAAATSTTGTENTTFGIFAGPGASTVSATTAPSAITSVTTSVGTGATAANLAVNNNSIGTAARGVSANGGAATIFPGLQIIANRIGNQTAGDADQVYAVGITAQGAPDGVVSANIVWVEGYVATAAQGINVGVNSAFGTFTIERNTVNRVRNNNAATYGAYGINLGGGSNHIAQNNFVSGVINDQTAGTGGFGTTFGAYGIRISSGTGHKIYHNSVNLFGALGGTISTDITAALEITSTTLTGIDVRNNIFSNQITSGNSGGTRNVAINIPSGATSAFNLTLNNNAYYQGTDANSRLAQVGSSFSVTGVGEYFAVNFDPTATTPASNLRAYTSTLNAAGTNDNASFATTDAPPFVSNTDLHVLTATPNRLESGGAAVGVMTDIDLETRPNGTAPDIGADEFVGVRGPVNDIQATAFIDPTNGSTRGAGVSFSPMASFTNVGTAMQTNVTVRYRILNASNVEVYNQTTFIPSIAPGATVIATFPSTSVPAGTYTIIATAENAGDTNPANNTITGTFSAFAPVSGTVSVGTGQTYASLTNPGGIFAALNAGGASGNVTINITSDLTGETGAVALNPISGGSTITIKPSGAARTISGTSPDNSGLIILNGADNVTIDGSLSGGTDRSLTITNNAAAGVVIWIRSASATDGATGDTVKNTILNGASGTTTIAGILTGSSTFGVAADAPNNNNTVQNNLISRVQNAMFVSGNAATFDQNWLITGNTFGSTTAADKLGFRGMLFGNGQNFVISNNTIMGVQSGATSTGNVTGIQIAFNNNGGTISGNRISDIKQINPTGFGSEGITLGSSGTASNITVVNNFISDVASQGSATVNANGNGYGIAVTTGGGYKIYFNSVNLQTNQVNANSITAAINVVSTITAAGAIDLRDNIFVNGETVGTRYAIYSGAAATVFSTIDYNDYFAQNVGFIGGSARVTLADFQTATAQDANSKAVDPLFVSLTDLHIQTGSPMIDMAVAGTGITTDIDGQTRGALPDIGADEIVAVAQPGTLALSAATYSIGEAAGNLTVTVNRTGGSDGAVAVPYTLTNGTAIGGTSCATSGVDFVNTGGTVSFAGGVTTQTFTVAICNDTLVEGNETFNVVLGAATGGATVGTPSTAVVTIIDDDVAQSGTLALSAATYSVGEAAGNVTITVNRTGGTDGAVGAAYTLTNGTATGGATCAAGVDYINTGGTVSFAAGAATQTFTVAICNDTIVEANETFTVTLANATGGTTIGTPATATVTIIDDDVAVLPSLTINNVRIREGNFGTVNAVFTVTASQTSTTPFSVGYATANGTATAGSDYTAVSGVLNFAPGEITKTISVPVIGDTVREPDETFFVNLSNPVNATIANGQGTGTIVDDDRAVVADFDKDGKTDFSVFRPSNGYWYVLQSGNNAPQATLFGNSTDLPVPGDYDGDGRTDIAVFRPSNGYWYILRSSDNGFVQVQFGFGTDKPVQGDYDGDGKTDIAVWRPSNGTWYLIQSSTNQFRGVAFGQNGDIPVQGDYDGDTKTDFAVYRSGVWYVLNSANGAVTALQFGAATDKALVGDFDGDGKTDYTVYRSGVWYIFQSLTNTSRAVSFGAATDIPTVGDYDGDGISDVAVFRPSNGTWYVLQSTNGFTAAAFGQMGDIPIPAGYQSLQ